MRLLYITIGSLLIGVYLLCFMMALTSVNNGSHHSMVTRRAFVQARHHGVKTVLEDEKVNNYSSIPDPLPLDIDDLEIEMGGMSNPSTSKSKSFTVVVIPYRDRETHLNITLTYVHSLLQHQRLRYVVYVAEQSGDTYFNKGRLMNMAFRSAMAKYPKIDCFIFHDVDMVPENEHNMYTCEHSPRHLSPQVSSLDYVLPYAQLVGGVFAISPLHYVKVNGYSNQYWSWGGEDDDMYKRLTLEHLPVSRPNITGRYTMLHHGGRDVSNYDNVAKLNKLTGLRYKTDGVGAACFTNGEVRVEEEVKRALYTWLLIDVGVR